MMFARIQGLSIIITPGGEHVIALALAGAAVGLDLDATNRLRITNKAQMMIMS